MYYRTDVFTALNLSVPQTWEDLVAVAQLLEGVDWDPRVPGGVARKMGVCFPKPLTKDLGTGERGIM
jgi:hypothetical protein